MTWPSQPAEPSTPVPLGGRRRESLASTALVMVFIAPPAGAVMGHIARRRTRRTGAAGGELAHAAVIIGWTITALAVLAVCLAGLLLLSQHPAPRR